VGTYWRIASNACSRAIPKCSPTQIEAINKSPIKVLYIAMDNDWAGQRMANIIKSGLDPRIIIKEVHWLPNKKDPNEHSYEEFQKVMNEAKNS
jgi:DNA primase